MSGGFLPDQMHDLAFWIRPDQSIVQAFLDGTNRLAQLNFKNGTFRGVSAVTQAVGANQPLWVASHASYGNRPVLDFSSGNDYMSSAAFSSVIAQPATYFIAGNFGVVANLETFMDAATAGSRNTIYNQASTFRIFAGTVLTGGASNTAPHIFDYVFNGASSNITVDGVSNATGNSGAQGLSGIRIGADIIPGGFLTGNLAEIICYAALLTDAERTKVRNYQSNYFQLPI